MISTRNAPIGVIDSGIGGLSMLKELTKSYPNENYIYFADNAFMPYGNRGSKTLNKRLLHLSNYLINEFDVKLIILACHTASIGCLEYLKKQLSVPVYGLSLEKWEGSSYKILCTKFSSKRYANSNCCACNRLAQCIEENIFDADTLKRRIGNTLSKINSIEHNIVLGCTHYELVAKYFKLAIPNKSFILPCKELVKDINFVKSTNKKNGDILMLCTMPTKAYIDKLWKVFNKEY